MWTSLSHKSPSRTAFAAAVAALLAFGGQAVASSSVHFTGAGSYASTPDASTFDFPGSFTIELWFQSDTVHTGTLHGPEEVVGTTGDTYFLTPLPSMHAFYWVTAER
jgi:hypothetical protein